jgi:hypothetical protein
MRGIVAGDRASSRADELSVVMRQE